jgi:acetyl esterase/lipase
MDRRLEKILQKVPDADASGDGKLTMEEFEAYRAKRRTGRVSGRRKEGVTGRDLGDGDVAPAARDVAYGSHPRQLLDFWQAESAVPTPVIVYFHGGGFVMGQKRLDSFQRTALAEGVSAVSAGYRFVKDAQFPAPLLDGARVVQFVRSKAAEWNIDPERVVLSGHSAGGLMSLWIAFHDDFAERTSDDPVARLSTRVSGVIAWSTPCSLDPLWIGENVGGKLRDIDTLTLGFGVKSVAELRLEPIRARVEDVCPINHVSANDPPVWLGYKFPLREGMLPDDVPGNELIHSPRFGVLLASRMKALGVECAVNCPNAKATVSSLDFLKRLTGATTP